MLLDLRLLFRERWMFRGARRNRLLRGLFEVTHPRTDTRASGQPPRNETAPAPLSGSEFLNVLCDPFSAVPPLLTHRP